MNRRDNGLSADAYAPLADLVAELADAMLATLRDAGVAAYAASPVTEPSEEPSAEEPLDRLYVDTSMKSTAERVLHSHLDRLREELTHDPGPGARARDAGATSEFETGTGTVERDDDAVWAEIVASFEESPKDGARPWPDQENLDEDLDEPSVAEGTDSTGRLPTARVIDTGGVTEPPPADDEGHYVPPPPPPLPSGDSVTRTAWAALVGGPLYLLLTVLLGWEVPGWAAFLAVAAFIGGFVTLVLRMGDEPRGPDDGAVV
ncbi:hypothetical protein [Actinomadura sp. HBU206391]|uniref:hypothetical protein n=1 Tax=Actinomadura sp. HBU206391 TaxID=2731692 RepID=UPI00165029D0|nr:hypothetical protein [Actinomadura sp. HBU206391]MBC6462957.1 hypothetical protein [Actinomadura sp. HBU206391]